MVEPIDGLSQTSRIRRPVDTRTPGVVSREVGANVKSSELVNARRARIVQAGLDVFLAKGFHGASVADVAARAGLTQGNLYNYIRSKDDILYLICDQAVTRYLNAVTGALDGVDDPRERLVRAVEATVTAIYDSGDHILLLHRESHALQPASIAAVLARADAFYALIRSIIADAAQAGAAEVADLDDAANIVTHVPAVFPLRRWRFDGKQDRRRMIDSATGFILRGLGVRAARGGARRIVDRQSAKGGAT